MTVKVFTNGHKHILKSELLKYGISFRSKSYDFSRSEFNIDDPMIKPHILNKILDTINLLDKVTVTYESCM